MPGANPKRVGFGQASPEDPPGKGRGKWFLCSDMPPTQRGFGEAPTFPERMFGAEAGRGGLWIPEFISSSTIQVGPYHLHSGQPARELLTTLSAYPRASSAPLRLKGHRSYTSVDAVKEGAEAAEWPFALTQL